MKVEEVLKEGKKKLIENQLEDANLIARVLLQFILKINQSELIVKQTQELEEEQLQEYRKGIQKIIEGTPLQYITNQQEFYKCIFYVNEDVLIPQPDTEILVEEVLNIAQKENKSKILDLCTGSGCIGIAIANYLEKGQVVLSDISKKALKIAEENAKSNHVISKISLIQSNLFEKIEEKFDIIVSNPPYIETKVIKTLSKQVQKEPKLALDGGEDGLFFYQKIIKEAPKHLTKKGYLCLEIGYKQKEKVIQLIKESSSYTNIKSQKDLAGNDRIIIAQLGSVPN